MTVVEDKPVSRTADGATMVRHGLADIDPPDRYVARRTRITSNEISMGSKYVRVLDKNIRPL